MTGKSLEKVSDQEPQKPVKTGGESSKRWLGERSNKSNPQLTAADNSNKKGDNHTFTTADDYKQVKGRAALEDKKQFVKIVDADLSKIDTIINKNPLKADRDSRQLRGELNQRKRDIQLEIDNLNNHYSKLQKNSNWLSLLKNRPLQPADMYKEKGEKHTYSTKKDFEDTYNRVQGKGNDGVKIDIEKQIEVGQQYQERLKGDIRKINGLLQKAPYIRSLGGMDDVEKQRDEYVERHDMIEKEISPLFERAGKAPESSIHLGLLDRRVGDMIVGENEYLKVINSTDLQAKRDIIELARMRIGVLDGDLLLPDTRSSRGSGDLVAEKKMLEGRIEEIQEQLNNPDQLNDGKKRTSRWLKPDTQDSFW